MRRIAPNLVLEHGSPANGLVTGPAVTLVLLAVLDSGSAEKLASAAPVIAVTFLTSRLSTRAIAQAARRRGWDGALDDRMETPLSDNPAQPTVNGIASGGCSRCCASRVERRRRTGSRGRAPFRARAIWPPARPVGWRPGCPALHAALAADGLDTSFARRGLLNVYESEEALQAARADADADRADGLPVRPWAPRRSTSSFPTSRVRRRAPLHPSGGALRSATVRQRDRGAGQARRGPHDTGVEVLEIRRRERA